jgi:hypothetical protein
MAKFVEASTRYQAKKLMPWAAVIARVEGGYYGFEFVTDYRVWKNQK